MLIGAWKSSTRTFLSTSHRQKGFALPANMRKQSVRSVAMSLRCACSLRPILDILSTHDYQFCNVLVFWKSFLRVSRPPVQINFGKWPVFDQRFLEDFGVIFIQAFACIIAFGHIEQSCEEF